MLRTKLKLPALLLTLILLSSSKCDFRPAPQGELCGVHADADALVVCNDPRRDEPNYERYIKKGDIVTNGDRYGQLKIYCESLRTDLKKCKRKK